MSIALMIEREFLTKNRQKRSYPRSLLTTSKFWLKGTMYFKHYVFRPAVTKKRSPKYGGVDLIPYEFMTDNTPRHGVEKYRFCQFVQFLFFGVFSSAKSRTELKI